MVLIVFSLYSSQLLLTFLQKLEAQDMDYNDDFK